MLIERGICSYLGQHWPVSQVGRFNKLTLIINHSKRWWRKAGDCPDQVCWTWSEYPVF